MSLLKESKKLACKILSVPHRLDIKAKAVPIKHHYDKEAATLLAGHTARLTSEQKKEILSEWKTYGKINTDWANYYYSCNGIFSTKYVPCDLYYNRILPVLNRLERFSYPQLQDKNFLDCIFADAARPYVIARNINHQFLDHDYCPVNATDIPSMCSAYPEIVIKPSVDTMHANHVQIISTRTDSFSQDLKNIMDTMKADFLIQKVVQQNDSLSALNEDSVNTLRVFSLLWNGEVHILGVVIRIGSKGVRVDNLVASNGVSCAVDKNGNMNSIGFDRYGNPCRKLGNGLVLEGHHIDGYEKVIELVKREHYKVAHSRLIGWDCTITKENIPLIIEANLDYPDASLLQLPAGPMFGNGSLFSEVMEYCL